MQAEHAFLQQFDVSRETFEKLQTYATLLTRWQGRINLVSARSLEHLWQRHFLDSAQLVRFLPPNPARLVDVGSGAGFPGLVLAVMGAREMTLIESNARRAAFLREVARATETPVNVLTGRVESDPVRRAVADDSGPDAVLARGCAPLPKLLDLVFGILSDHTYCIFPKGRGYRAELDEARRSWSFDVECHQSLSAEDATILRLDNVSPA